MCLHVLYRWVPQALSYAGFVGDRGSAVLSDFGKGVSWWRQWPREQSCMPKNWSKFHALLVHISSTLNQFNWCVFRLEQCKSEAHGGAKARWWSNALYRLEHSHYTSTLTIRYYTIRPIVYLFFSIRPQTVPSAILNTFLAHFAFEYWLMMG